MATDARQLLKPPGLLCLLPGQLRLLLPLLGLPVTALHSRGPCTCADPLRFFHPACACRLVQAEQGCLHAPHSMLLPRASTRQCIHPVHLRRAHGSDEHRAGDALGPGCGFTPQSRAAGSQAMGLLRFGRYRQSFPKRGQVTATMRNERPIAPHPTSSPTLALPDSLVLANPLTVE